MDFNETKDGCLEMEVYVQKINFDDVIKMGDSDVRQLLDHRGYNALMMAAEAGHINAVDNLISRWEDLNVEVNGETAVSLAFSQGHYEIVLRLLRENSRFPHNYQHELVSNDLKAFVELSINMHDLVKSCDDGKILEILANNRGLKHFYDSDNNSLIKTSLELKKFETFKVLWQSNLRLGPHEDIWKILENFTIEEKAKFSKIQLIDYENFCDLSDQAITDYRDLRGFNSLMIASEGGHINAVDFCLKKGFFIIDTEVNGMTATSLALNAKNNKILLMLLNSNAEFPKSMNFEEVEDEELIRFIKMSNDIHCCIGLNQLDKVREIITANPNLYHFYDLKNRSAFRHAVEEKKFDIYKILVESFVNFGPNESYDAMRQGLDDDDKLQLTSIQFELSEALVSPTVLTLMSHSFVGHESKNKNLRRSTALEAFSFLMKIPRAEKILKIIATQKKYQIVFDFTRDTIQILDASAEIYMSGTFYTNGRIYIAAGKLFDNIGRYEVLGALIHELCHFAMFVTYDNMAKPYRNNDEDAKVCFDQIIAECKALKKSENIIFSAFDLYEPEFYPAELIVRPVHMDAFYFGLDELKDIEEKFKSLYEFYDEKCMPEMERILPELERKSNFTEKDEKISKLRKFNVVLGVLIALALIFGGLSAYFLYNPTLSWRGLSKTDKSFIKNATVNFRGADVKFGELFSNDSNVFELLSSEQIKSTLKSDTEELSKAVNFSFHHYVFLTWSNMTEQLRNLFLSMKVNFQGQNVSISSICSEDSLELLGVPGVRQILSNNPFKVSVEQEILVKVFIERFYVDEKVEVMGEQDYDQIMSTYMSRNITSYYSNGKPNTDHADVKHFEQILKETETHGVFVLSGFAGDGKSTTFRNFGLTLKNVFPAKWVQFVDLKKYSDSYKAAQRDSFNNLEYLVSFLGVNLLKLPGLELKVFERLFLNGSTIFLWDGVDEISPLYKNLMLDLTSCIHNFTKNLQFVSTRPQYSEDFKQRLHVPSYKLIPFGKLDRLELLVKQASLDTLDVNGNNVFDELKIYYNNSLENFENRSEIFEKISEKLKIDSKDLHILSERIMKGQKLFQVIEKRGGYRDRTLSNPLLILMVSELASDDSFDFKNLSLVTYDLYEILISKKFRLIHQKGDVVTDDYDKIAQSRKVNIIQVHQGYALKYILDKNEFINKFLAIVNLSLSDLSIMRSVKKLSNEEIARFGILQVNSETDFDFAHRTFAEFFVAQFLTDSIDDVDPETNDGKIKIMILYNILIGIVKDEFPIVKSFLGDFAAGQTSSPFFHFWYEQNIRNHKFSKGKTDFLEAIQFSHFYKLHNKNFLKSLNFASCDYAEISEILESIKAFEEIYGNEMVKSVVRYRRLGKMESPFLCSIHRNWNHFLLILQVSQELLNKSEISSIMLDHLNFFNTSILMMVAKSRNESDFKHFWEFINENMSAKELKTLLANENVYFETALQYSATNSDNKVFLFMRNIYRKNFTSKELQDIIFMQHPKKHSFLFDVFTDASVETSKDLAQFLFEIFKDKTIKLREFLNRRETNKFRGHTIFTRFKSSEKLKFFNELLKKTSE